MNRRAALPSGRVRSRSAMRAHIRPCCRCHERWVPRAHAALGDHGVHDEPWHVSRAAATGPEPYLQLVILRPRVVGREQADAIEYLSAERHVRREKAPGPVGRDLERVLAVVGHRQRAPVPPVERAWRRGGPERPHRAADAVDVWSVAEPPHDSRDPIRRNADVVVSEGDDAAPGGENSRVPPGTRRPGAVH